MSKLNFYDPLYDFVTFEEAESGSRKSVFDAGFGGACIKSNVSDIGAFLHTPEVNRLSFLRQSDLAFLVFPSSTHTRFAHGIGCCYLGYMAARGISVGIKNGESDQAGRLHDRVVHLAEWLQKRAWKEEFLLALLLHDIGHFAFSHTLEGNRELWKAIGEEITHENVAREFILGEGDMFDTLCEVLDAPAGVRRVHELLKRSDKIEPDVMAYLIAGNQDDLANFSPRKQNELRMLHELTSGLLDLDRVDHYRRDSYFSGMRFASNLNFSTLLNGFSIWYDPKANNAKHQVRLSQNAIGHALTLLHAKERLTQDCFEHDDNIAYEVMLQQAFNYYVLGDSFFEPGAMLPADLDSIKRTVRRLLIATDDELLWTLSSNGTPKAKEVVCRIRNRQPYRRVIKQSWPKGVTSPDISDLRARIADRGKVSPDLVVIHLGKSYGRSREKRATEWLKLDALFDENGQPLDAHPTYRRQIEHFKQVQDDADDVFWVFTPSSNRKFQDRILKAVNSVINEAS